MFINKLSESKSNAFQECKLKYKYKYVDYLAEENKGDGAMPFGSYIHKIFEDGYKDSTFENLLKISVELKPKYKFNEEVYTQKIIETCLRNFENFNKTLEETVGSEIAYEIEIEKDIWLNGVIDRVIKSKTGEYLIIDYKTGKRSLSKFEMFKDGQMQGYAYAIHRLFNVPIEKVTVAHYYPTRDKFIHSRYSVPAINTYLKKKRDEVWCIRKMRKGDLVPERNRFCDWCAFQDVCPLFASPLEISSRLDKKQKSVRPTLSAPMKVPLNDSGVK